MTYTAKWGRQPPRTITTVQELDQLLDDVATQRGDEGTPFMVSIYREPADPDGEYEGLQIGVGHPQRSFAFYFGPGGGWGWQPDLDPLPDDIDFDHGGQATEYHPDETQVAPEAARQAARRYVTTGQRPDGLRWRTS